MRPKERVLAALNHREPDRVPMNYHADGNTSKMLKAHFGIQGNQNRSFTYSEEPAPLDANVGAGVTRMFGAPLQRVPDNVSETGQIIGSYGFRRAGSKAVGNY